MSRRPPIPAGGPLGDRWAWFPTPAGWSARRRDLDEVIEVLFSTDRGTEFSSFAVPTILGELRRHFRDTGWTVHSSARVAGGGQAGREGAERVVRPAGAGADGLRAVAVARGRPGDGAGVAAVNRGYEDVEDGLSVASARRSLTDQERELLRLRFDEALTQTEIAERIGVSQMQVSRLLRRTIDRLQILVGEK